MMVCSDPLAAVWREALPEVAEKLAATLRLGPPAQLTLCDVPAVNYFFLIPKTTHTTPHIYSSSDISLFVVKDIFQYHGFQLHGVAQECMNSGLCASYRLHNEVCSVFGCPFHRLGPSASHVCQQLSTRSSSFRYFLPPVFGRSRLFRAAFSENKARRPLHTALFYNRKPAGKKHSHPLVRRGPLPPARFSRG